MSKIKYCIFLLLSIILTNYVHNLAINMDDIMIYINDNYKDYEIIPINSSIYNDEIIPGVCGKKVNIKKSYDIMKKIGIYDDNYYVYKNIVPRNNIFNNKDKYIIDGNSIKNNIYIIIKLDENNYKKIDYKKNNYNYLIDYNFYINHYEILNKVIKNNNILISKMNYKEYKEIRKYYKKETNKNIICFNNRDNEFLNICSSNNSITIRNDELIRDNYFYNIKQIAKSGKIIYVYLNDNLNKELELIEQYIKNKGLNINTIDNIVEC